MPPLLEELQSELEGECVADTITLDLLSRDGSPFSVRPQAAIYPKTINDIKKCVLFAKKYSIPLTVRGRGCGTRGACLTDGLVVDMSRYFDKMDHLEVIHNKVTIQAGMNYLECASRLASWGYTLPFVDDTDEEMSIGGMFANGYRGGPSLLHGGITDWVESLRVILDDGNEYHIGETTAPTGRLLVIYTELLSYLKKEAPVFRARRPHVSDHTMGYDVFTSHISPKMLIHLLAGAQGTLGIITEITFRLSLKALQKNAIAIHVPTLHDLPSIRETILKTSPTSLYGFGIHALTYAQKASKNRILTRHEKDPFTLFAIYENKKQTTLSVSPTEEAYRKINVPNENKILLSKEECRAYESVVHLQHRNLADYTGNTLQAVSICDDVVVPPQDYVSAIREFTSLCEEFGLIYSITGDVGNNVLSTIPLLNLSSPEASEKMLELLSRTGHIIKQYHGSVSYKEGDGLTNTPLIPFLYGEQIAKRIMGIKTIWDPYNIFNPGKKTTIDFSYLKKHFMFVPPARNS